MWPAYLVYVLAGMWPAYLVYVLAGMWPAYLVYVLASPETAGPPCSQGCGPLMGSSGSPGWLLAFGLVMFLVRGVVEGLGGGRGARCEFSNAGRNSRCSLLL